MKTNEIVNVPVVIYGYISVKAKDEDKAEIKARQEFWNNVKGLIENGTDMVINDAEINP